MNPGFMTTAFLLAVVFLVIAYDLFALLYYGPEATISNVLKGLDEGWHMLGYLLCFGAGMLAWHFFSK